MRRLSSRPPHRLTHLEQPFHFAEQEGDRRLLSRLIAHTACRHRSLVVLLKHSSETQPGLCSMMAVWSLDDTAPLVESSRGAVRCANWASSSLSRVLSARLWSRSMDETYSRCFRMSVLRSNCLRSQLTEWRLARRIASRSVTRSCSLRALLASRRFSSVVVISSVHAVNLRRSHSRSAILDWLARQYSPQVSSSLSSLSLSDSQ
mmetsp:Transcript_26908/g.67646  ORF Transcript_26908/g.67646 Transcript_26908/m.67646 type:complete len:205 (-) Transcript_26908:241-855(-)